MNKEQIWEYKWKILHIRALVLCKSRVAVQLRSLLIKWHNFDVSSFFHQELLVSVKTDSVFVGVHVLCRDLVMGELGAACPCWCCCREIIVEWYRKDFSYTDTHLTYCRKVYLVHELVPLQSAVHMVWIEPAVRFSLLYPFRLCSHTPNIMTRPVLFLLLTSVKAVPIFATLKKWWVIMHIFFFCLILLSEGWLEDSLEEECIFFHLPVCLHKQNTALQKQGQSNEHIERSPKKPSMDSILGKRSWNPNPTV